MKKMVRIDNEKAVRSHEKDGKDQQWNGCQKPWKRCYGLIMKRLSDSMKKHSKDQYWKSCMSPWQIVVKINSEKVIWCHEKIW